MPELTAFDRVKSMIRYLPPNWTDGLARNDERIDRRSPSPPARMTAMTGFGMVVLRCCRPGLDPSIEPLRPGQRRGRRAVRRFSLREQLGVHEGAVELDHPVQVGAGRVARVAFPADDLALPDRLARLDRVAGLEVGVPGRQALRV